MSFKNSREGKNIRKEFSEITLPKLPIKRQLTDEENRKMIRHFQNHSWSHIDANNQIILGGGEDERGKYYITEEDLNQLS